jgi:MiaB-like tRNA modifying enzyme
MYAYIETYGCSANQNNSEILAGMLTGAGFIVIQDPKLADIVIINTCIVKGPTEQKMRSAIGLYKSKKLIVCGCMPDVEAKIIREIAPKASILGTHHFSDIIKVVRKTIDGERFEVVDKTDEIKLCMPKMPKNKIVGINQISEGCLGECTYCYTRLAKGKLFSYPKDLILKSIQNDIDSGAKEIWITSQDCAAYGLDKGKRELPELLNSILKLKGKFFIRLGMMNPNNVKPILKKLIECYKDKKMFKFIHIPIQSGSDKVLEEMDRKYKVKDCIEIIEKFRKEFPEMLISTDMICGYPTETDDDFQMTLDLMKKIKPNIINTSKFWAMPKTFASRLKQLNSEVIKSRSTRLSFLQKQIGLEINKNLLGKEYHCIVDDYGKQSMISRNLNYMPILVEKAKIGDIVDLKINGFSEAYLIGEIIKEKSN